MITCKALEDFSLKRFNELKNIVRNDNKKNEEGMIYQGDTFECEQDIAYYLTEGNDYKKPFVTLEETIPKKEIVNEITTTYRTDMPTTTGLDVVTTYKSTRKKKSSKK